MKPRHRLNIHTPIWLQNRTPRAYSTFWVVLALGVLAVAIWVINFWR